MTLLGILVAIVGIAGFVANFMGLVRPTGLMGNLTFWGGVAIAGAVLAMLTRRPRD